MKKAVWLSLGALILVGAVFFAIWYIGEKKEMKAANKEAFIPYSSSIVLCVNSKPQLAANLSNVLDKELEQYRQKLLMRMADSLQGCGYVVEYPYVLALRVQGGEEVASLHIMEHNQVLAKGDMVDF